MRRTTYWIPVLFGLVLASCGEPDSMDHTPAVESHPPSLSETLRPGVEAVELSEEDQELLHIETVRVEPQRVTFDIPGPGLVEASPEGLALVSTPVSGIVTNIHAHEGERVEEGEPLVTLESLAFADIYADYLEAHAERNWLEIEEARVRELVEGEIRARRDLERIRADRMRVHAREQAARSRLRALGITDEKLQQWENQPSEERALFTLYAPMDGQIDRHEIDLGEAVRADQLLLDIVDPTRILVRGMLDPGVRPYLQEGGEVLIRPLETEQRPGAPEISGVIETVQPALDSENRSLVVNARLRTDGIWPVIGQRIRFVARVSPEEDRVLLPSNAIQYDGSTATVYVKRSESRFERRSVTIERTFEEEVLLAEGLNAGEEVAVTQLFSLKALLQFDQFAEE